MAEDWRALILVPHQGLNTRKAVKEVVRDTCGRFLRRKGKYLIFDDGDGTPEAVIRITTEKREGETPSGPFSVIDYAIEIQL